MGNFSNGNPQKIPKTDAEKAEFIKNGGTVEQYMALAASGALSPELLHRVTTVATGGLDALPHNGAVVTLLAICGLTHREAYRDIFMVAVLFPIVALVLMMLVAALFGAF